MGDEQRPYSELIRRLLDAPGLRGEAERHEVVSLALGHLLQETISLHLELASVKKQVDANTTWIANQVKRTKMFWRVLAIGSASSGAVGAFLGGLTSHITLH